MPASLLRREQFSSYFRKFNFFSLLVSPMHFSKPMLRRLPPPPPPEIHHPQSWVCWEWVSK